VVAALAAITVGFVTPASAATVDGTATIETPSHGTVSYPASSSTQFTLVLPTGAVCSGSTTGGGYHVYSYLVPYGTNVQNLTIVQGAPSTGYGLFDYTPNYIGPINVPSNDFVPTLPVDLEWGPAVSAYSLRSALLDNGGTSGVWEAGVLCANASGAVTDYWNTEVTFNSSGTDPDGFTWSAAPGDPNNGANPEVPYALILPVLAVAIIGGTLLIKRRRRSATVV
jgi:hypothetical protein